MIPYQRRYTKRNHHVDRQQEPEGIFCEIYFMDIILQKNMFLGVCVFLRKIKTDVYELREVHTLM